LAHRTGCPLHPVCQRPHPHPAAQAELIEELELELARVTGRVAWECRIDPNVMVLLIRFFNTLDQVGRAPPPPRPRLPLQPGPRLTPPRQTYGDGDGTLDAKDSPEVGQVLLGVGLIQQGERRARLHCRLHYHPSAAYQIR
jgi:hypothetical protein